MVAKQVQIWIGHTSAAGRQAQQEVDKSTPGDDFVVAVVGRPFRTRLARCFQSSASSSRWEDCNYCKEMGDDDALVITNIS